LSLLEATNAHLTHLYDLSYSQTKIEGVQHPQISQGQKESYSYIYFRP